nr:EFR1 family ferrodoxin [Clostridium beijerinckii]
MKVKSVIYYFTGTGNNLQVAKKIAEGLPDCKLVSMGKGKHDSNEVYDYIGFVYPTYALNLPRRVTQFISEMSLEKSKNAYFFAVTGCGNISGVALTVPAKILAKKGATLNFAEKIIMVENYVAMYKMNERNPEKYQIATDNIPALVKKIVAKTQQPVGKVNELLNVSTAIGQKLIYARKDKGFNVSDDCIGCRTCEAVCPVSNIVMKNKKPSFKHNCEQCMACVQWCPKQAINYKNKTQSRGRYTNPSISLKELIDGNK